VAVRLPQFRCAGCGHGETGVSWPSYCRSTPKFDELRAHISALMPYRVAAELLSHLLPVDAGNRPETLRGHTLKVGTNLRDTQVQPAAAASAITGRNLQAVGVAANSELTAFTDGCPGLLSVLADAGCKTPPIADWFHIAMRLQHAEQAASGLSTDTLGRMQAKVAIVAEVDRLHWRIWNGKAKDARITFDRIRKVMHVFQGERRHRDMGVPSRKLWHALHEVDNYLLGQSARLVNYAKRYRAGLRVGTSVTEGTANFLVNRRMNKAQQMRWSRRGADLLLQVRCAVYNGRLGPVLGHRFEPTSSRISELAIAA
jgi:hypothetical protein